MSTGKVILWVVVGLLAANAVLVGIGFATSFANSTPDSDWKDVVALELSLKRELVEAHSHLLVNARLEDAGKSLALAIDKAKQGVRAESEVISPGDTSYRSFEDYPYR